MPSCDPNGIQAFCGVKVWRDVGDTAFVGFLDARKNHLEDIEDVGVLGRGLAVGGGS